MSVNLITLGCAKNLVDSEKLLQQLRYNGFEVYHDSDVLTDTVIINTCGFISDAKAESVDTILRFVEAKKNGQIRKLIVTGCLSQRYADELIKEIPEVDAFFGVHQEPGIIKYLEGKYNYGIWHERFLTTPSHYSYLKISEGCNRNCSFCIIPSIRGKQVSLPVEIILREAEFLSDRGVKELILVAQDLISYGMDIYRKKAIGELLKELTQLKKIEWIRLHYIYPLGFPPEEISGFINSSPKICKYLDIPIQHISDRILKEMKRGHGRSEIESLLKKVRENVPDIAIRSTLITGFPGESEKEFDELRRFIINARFERLGVFSYSEEEGTMAARKLKDDVPEDVKRARKDELLSIQESISLDLNSQKIGRIYRVLIDRKENGFYAGRTESDSPEIDNEVLVPVNSGTLIPGMFYNIRITGASEFDLFGKPEVLE